MHGYRGAFPWPLLLLQQSTWALLRVSVPSLPIRALPFSDLWLPCNFSDPSSPITLSDLAVTWKRDKQTIAKYLGKFQPTRLGAEMSEERLRVGDASLLLPRLQDVDSGVYTCLVVFTPEKDEGRFEVKVEAEPHVALGSTKLQLAKQAALTCTVSGFYPGNISVEWLKDGTVVKGPKTSLLQDSQNGLYNASSILQLTPDVADAKANFSCSVRHKSLEGPLKKHFQVQLQALPALQVFPVVLGNTLEVLKCLVNGFYPQDVQVHWLQNREPQPPIESRPQMLPNGTFSMQSIILPQQRNPNISYVCQVQHEAWDAPLELTAHWQPKEEGDRLPCPTPQHPQSSGAEGMPCLCSTTPIPPSPTSATGTVAVLPWLAFGLGLVFCIIAGIMLCIAYKKRKNKSYPDSESKCHLNPESAGLILKSENDSVPGGTTTSM